MIKKILSLRNLIVPQRQMSRTNECRKQINKASHKETKLFPEAYLRQKQF